MVSALIFHDNILVLATQGHSLAERTQTLFGLAPDVICELPLQLTAPPDESNQERGEPVHADAATGFGQVLDSVWYWTRMRFDAAVRSDESWYRALRDNWYRLLPGTSFPPHDNSTIGTILGGTYVPSLAREPPVIFNRDQFRWMTMSNDRLPALILDNDVRALFYEGLAVQLLELCTDDATTPSIKYAGGCMRGALQLAYANTSQLARAAIPAERRIEHMWLDFADTDATPVRLPVWIDALLSTRPKTPAEVAERLRHWRERAAPFRRRRQDLELNLGVGNVNTAKEIQNALQQDLKKLGDATVAVGAEAVRWGVKAVAPPAADLAAAAGSAVIAETGAGAWIRLGWLRLRRPQLWVITDMGRQAMGGRNSFENASTAFGFPRGVTDEIPAGFLSRLGQIAWVA